MRGMRGGIGRFAAAAGDRHHGLMSACGGGSSAPPSSSSSSPASRGHARCFRRPRARRCTRCSIANGNGACKTGRSSRPASATHRYDDKLPDVSLAAWKARADKSRRVPERAGGDRSRHAERRRSHQLRHVQGAARRSPRRLQVRRTPDAAQCGLRLSHRLRADAEADGVRHGRRLRQIHRAVEGVSEVRRRSDRADARRPEERHHDSARRARRHRIVDPAADHRGSDEEPAVGSVRARAGGGWIRRRAIACRTTAAPPSPMA